ncbi:MAG: HEAT repeat domain-containing protein, partial [Candidatus Saganbacteria bacterium]|nr:HEAT repeat domain-containing protein [Candidatus Saganbacteria bacterium]
FKRLGFKDRNNNGIIEAKENNPLNRLIKADEGYGSILTPHPADTNKDRKIDEKESWNYYYLQHKAMTSDIFLASELKEMKHKDKAVFLNKIAGYLENSADLLSSFLSAILQIGVRSNDKELCAYAIHSIRTNKDFPITLSHSVGKKAKNINGKRANEIFLGIIEKEPKKNTMRVFDGLLGKKNNRNLLFAYIKKTTIIRTKKPAEYLLETKTYKNDSEKKKLTAFTLISDIKKYENTKTLRSLNSDAIPALRKVFLQGSSEEKETALDILIETKDPAIIPLLTESINNDFPASSQVNSVHALAKFNGTAVFTYLSRISLSSTKARVRLAALEGIAKTNTPKKIGLFSRVLLNDKDQKIRKYAAWILGNAKNPKTFPVLYHAYRSDTDEKVKNHALIAIGKSAHPLAAKFLSDLLMNSKNDSTRSIAALALIKTKSPSAFDALYKAYKNDRSLFVRMNALEAIGATKHPKAVTVLFKALTDHFSNTEIKMSAARGLSEINNRSALSALSTALRNEEAPNIKRYIRNMLAIMKKEMEKQGGK